MVRRPMPREAGEAAETRLQHRGQQHGVPVAGVEDGVVVLPRELLEAGHLGHDHEVEAHVDDLKAQKYATGDAIEASVEQRCHRATQKWEV